MSALTDFALSVGLLALAAGVLAGYGARVALRGRVQSDRVDKEGSSAFLGRTPMLVVYWALAPLGRLLARLGVSANAVTGLSLVLGLLSGLSLVVGHFGAAAALFVVSALCDALDGFVARETGTASGSGEMLDAAVDRYNDFFFIAGLIVFYRQDAVVLALALLALLGSFMVSYATAKAGALQVAAPRGSMRRVERAAYLTAGVGFAPIMGFFRPSLADAPVVLALLLVGVVANASAVWRLMRIAELVRWREASAAKGPFGAARKAAARELERVSR